MKQLDPNDVRCLFCNQPIKGNEVVALVEAPGHLSAVTHLDHPGVRDTLLTSPDQITTGALLQSAISLYEGEGIDLNEANCALDRKYASLTQAQRDRFKVMVEKAYVDPHDETSK